MKIFQSISEVGPYRQSHLREKKSRLENYHKSFYTTCDCFQYYTAVLGHSFYFPISKWQTNLYLICNCTPNSINHSVRYLAELSIIALLRQTNQLIHA